MHFLPSPIAAPSSPLLFLYPLLPVPPHVPELLQKHLHQFPLPLTVTEKPLHSAKCTLQSYFQPLPQNIPMSLITVNKHTQYLACDLYFHGFELKLIAVLSPYSSSNIRFCCFCKTSLFHAESLLRSYLTKKLSRCYSEIKTIVVPTKHLVQMSIISTTNYV